MIAAFRALRWSLPRRLLRWSLPRRLLRWSLPRRLLRWSLPRRLLRWSLPRRLLRWSLPRRLLRWSLPRRLLLLSHPRRNCCGGPIPKPEPIKLRWSPPRRDRHSSGRFQPPLSEPWSLSAPTSAIPVPILPVAPVKVAQPPSHYQGTRSIPINYSLPVPAVKPIVALRTDHRRSLPACHCCQNATPTVKLPPAGRCAGSRHRLCGPYCRSQCAPIGSSAVPTAALEAVES